MYHASQKAAIATGHHLTSEAGHYALEQSGNAADGAIAALWAACICEPILISPAGGGFAMIAHPHHKNPQCLDFFVRTPRIKRKDREESLSLIYADFGTTQQAFHCGAGSCATPSLMQGIYALHARYGTLPMLELMAPALDYAQKGVKLTSFQAEILKIVTPIVKYTEQARALFCKDDEPKKQDDLFKNPHLANCLEALGREGIRLATHGEIAQNILKICEGGYLTREDLELYEPEWRHPLKLDLSCPSNWQIAFNPPPAAGGSLVKALLQAYQKDAQRKDHFDPVLFINILQKLDRKWKSFGKPANFNFEKEEERKGVGNSIMSRGTTHISVIDKNNMVVSLTASNGEGAGLIVPECGFMMNNMLGEDDLLIKGIGSWQPNTQMASMMSPIIARTPSGELLASGSGGSNRIRSAMAQTLIRTLLHKEPIEKAIRAPRFHSEDHHFYAEDYDDDATLDDLKKAHEKTTLFQCEHSMFFGGVHSVLSNSRDQKTACGDPRRGGHSLIF